MPNLADSSRHFQFGATAFATLLGIFISSPETSLCAPNLAYLDMKTLYCSPSKNVAPALLSWCINNAVQNAGRAAQGKHILRGSNFCLTSFQPTHNLHPHSSVRLTCFRSHLCPPELACKVRQPCPHHFRGLTCKLWLGP